MPNLTSSLLSDGLSSVRVGNLVSKAEAGKCNILKCCHFFLSITLCFHVLTPYEWVTFLWNAPTWQQCHFLLRAVQLIYRVLYKECQTNYRENNWKCFMNSAVNDVSSLGVHVRIYNIGYMKMLFCCLAVWFFRKSLTYLSEAVLLSDRVIEGSAIRDQLMWGE